jgi:VanZ family protein
MKLLTNVLRWTIWWVLLASMTWVLLSPQPAALGEGMFDQEASFVVSKSIHIVAYGTLSALVGWLPALSWQRVALWVLLAIHGCLTEYLQMFIPGRYSSLRDVFVNWVGLALGVALVLLVFRRSRSAS